VETPRQKFLRVLTAFEDLAEQEKWLLRSEDFAEVVALQKRLDPLVNFLVSRAEEADEPLRHRVHALIERRRTNAEALGARITQARAELSEINLSRKRISQVVPAYRQAFADDLNGQLCVRG
jgi:hypothetical protein